MEGRPDRLGQISLTQLILFLTFENRSTRSVIRKESRATMAALNGTMKCDLAVIVDISVLNACLGS